MATVLTHIFVLRGKNADVTIVEKCQFKDIDVVVTPFLGPQVVEVDVFLVGFDRDVEIVGVMPLSVYSSVTISKGLGADAVDAVFSDVSQYNNRYAVSISKEEQVIGLPYNLGVNKVVIPYIRDVDTVAVFRLFQNVDKVARKTVSNGADIIFTVVRKSPVKVLLDAS